MTSVPSLRERLLAVKVLFRDPNTLALIGIPYRMRPGQQPGDLLRAAAAAAMSLTRGARAWDLSRTSPSPDLSDWLWLGCPGWWGDLTKDDQEAIQAFLVGKELLIPGGPWEWTDLAMDEGDS